MKTVFVDFHNDKTHIRGICLWWLDEIHIDRKYENSQFLNVILEHENKHQKLTEKELAARYTLKRWWLMLYEEMWEWWDGIRIDSWSGRWRESLDREKS